MTDWSWQLCGIFFCLLMVAFCAVMTLVEHFRSHKRPRVGAPDPHTVRQLATAQDFKRWRSRQ
jgi:predicted small integral membrane protein